MPERDRKKSEEIADRAYERKIVTDSFGIGFLCGFAFAALFIRTLDFLFFGG